MDPPGGASTLAVAVSEQTAVLLKPGDRLGGKYRLERLLGQGAAGQVWLAIHETIGRSVAVKVLRNESKGRAAVRFLQEARIAGSLQNRYVVSTFDFGNTPTGLLYMVMEHLHGETLGARLARDPPLRVRDLLRYIGQALIGLHEVHRAGVVHRDLKPDNIFLVEESGELYPKLLDFGVCRADEAVLGPEISRLTATGMTVGTPLYMAPEQARGKRDQLDGRTDLYALGVIMYRAISGQSPFEDGNVVDLLMAAVSATVAPALIDVRPDVPQALSDLVQKAMAPQQQRRFADAEALRAALAAVAPQVPELMVCQVGRSPRRVSSTDEHVPLATLIPPTDMDPTLQASLNTNTRPKPRWIPWTVGGASVLVAAVLGAVALGWGKGPIGAEGVAAPPAAITAAEPPAAALPVPAPAPRPPVPDGAGDPAPSALAREKAAMRPMARPAPVTRAPRPTKKEAPASAPPPRVFTQPDF